MTQTRFGSSTWKSRSSRLSAIGNACFESVVRRKRFLRRAAMSCAPISLMMRLRLVLRPASLRSAWMRGEPYVRRLSMWDFTISFVSASSSVACFDGSQPRHA